MARGLVGVTFGLALLGALAVTQLYPNGAARAADRARSTVIVRPDGGMSDLAPAIAKLYVETESQILGYRVDNKFRAERVCKMPLPLGGPSGDLTTDKNGDILVPSGEAAPEGVTIYAGPGMCGKQLGMVTLEGAGYPVDASSLNALTGKIVFASVLPFSLSGGVFVCHLSGRCSQLYTGQPSTDTTATAVAIDSAGDCWAVLPYYPSSGSTAIEYFRGCSHDGVLVSGWVNPSGGGLDVDGQGNLLSVSSPGGSGGSALYVYRGCKPACTKIGGPFPLEHDAVYGHVSRDNTLFATTGEGFVDVYAYRPTSLKRMLTFSVGSSQSYGVAFSPGR